MKQGDFFSCLFKGDLKRYYAEILSVDSDKFKCRFVHSGKNYVFDSHTFIVLESEGAFKRGTLLVDYQLFTDLSSPLKILDFVAVQFEDRNRYLGVVNTLIPTISVTFLHSGSFYSFDNNKNITSSSGKYPVGQKIINMTPYKIEKEVELQAPDGAVDPLAKRISRIKSFVPTGDGHIDYLDGKIVGSVLVSNFDVNNSALKEEFLGGLSQLAASLNSSGDSAAFIVGRASQTGNESNNDILSQNRANAVSEYLTDVRGVSETKIKDKFGLGSQYPIKDSRGIEEMLNRSVQIFFYIPMVIPPPAPPQLKSTADQGSKEWALSLMPSVTVGAAVAGTFIAGKLKNRKTGETRTGFYAGGGIGASLKFMPVTGGIDTDWKNFTTDDYYTMDDFDGTLCRFTTAGGGIFIVGYSFSYISFPMMGANSIDIGGWEFGSVGGGGTTTAGVWKFN